MNREDLERKFNTEKGRYENDIENKNATTYEESLLYDIDITNVADDYDKAYDEFTSFADDMRNLTDDDTRFDDTIAILHENAGAIKTNLNTINFSEISNYIRAASENVVFASYQENFNKLNEENKKNIERIEERFKTHDGLKKTLERYKSSRDNAIDEIERNKYERHVSNTKDNMANCLNQINSQLEKLKTNNVLMIDILDKGLKKSKL